MIAKIYGNNPVNGEDVKEVIDFLNNSYAGLNLQVKNMTCYIRMVDEFGEIEIEPSADAEVYTFTFKTFLKNGEVTKKMEVKKSE